MSDITSAAEYVELISIEVDLPSGARFKVRAPNPYELAELLKVVPEEGPPEDFRTFAKEYLPRLWEPIVHPCILEPKVPAKVVHYEDALVLLEAVFTLTGAKEGIEGESFPDTEPSPDA